MRPRLEAVCDQNTLFDMENTFTIATFIFIDYSNTQLILYTNTLRIYTASP